MIAALQRRAGLQHARMLRRAALAASLASLAMLLTDCGKMASSNSSASIPPGSSTTPPVVNNVQPVTIDAGPVVNGQAVGDADILFTTVTVCSPGTVLCQNIDHVAVDTGSSGLRILDSVLTVSLPLSSPAAGQVLANCVQYADNTYQWGAVATADIKLAGEMASSVPVQVIGLSSIPGVPTSCSAGGMPVQTAQELGANGILGVGLFRQDCGPACTSTTPPSAAYYTCTTSTCSVSSASLAAQLQNPVWLFPQDNNGLAIILPQVGAGGSASVSGSMIFGIGTASNNGVGSASLQAANDVGNFTTTFNGTAYSESFIDSGSNGYFFLTASQVGMPECNQTQAPGFYCPVSPMNFTAINTGPNPTGATGSISSNVAFSVANAISLFNSPNTAFNNLGGDNAGAFDWGLPFFFGRTVFIGIESQTAGSAVGPYWGY